MRHKKMTTRCWGLGLSNKQAEELRDFLGEEYSLELWTADAMPTKEDMENTPPYLIWISPKALASLKAQPEGVPGPLGHIPKVLLLSGKYSRKDMEIAADSGMTEIVRPPMSRSRVRGIMRRAMEVQNMQSDILSMTRNIMLERELLERKNELLNFLVNFLTSISGTLDMQQILKAAYSGLDLLLPVKGLCAAFSNTSEVDNGLDMYLFSSDTSSCHEAWKKALHKQAEQVFGRKLSPSRVFSLELPGADASLAETKPSAANFISLPVAAGDQPLGVLLLFTDMENSLGRDQAVSLNSALQHLGLCVRNAQYLSRAQMYADYDALTCIHSRRHFEDRLAQEMDKFSRYGQPFSLLLLDIDHFKAVNDTYGHQAGDEVLKGVASVIKSTIRGSDYCARYGGEEFVILLPHTSSAKALALAERLRCNVASHTFLLDSGPVFITASLGIAQANAKESISCGELVRQADANLYMAKESGRNRTCDAFSMLKAAQ